MRKYLLLSFIIFMAMQQEAVAQFETFKDSVVQLYGVVMTADSLVGVPSVSVMVRGQNRGTITNDQGVFSIVVLKGDDVEFTSIGFKPVLAHIPENLTGNEQSIIQLMVNDTVYLPATIIRNRPTREQFERDFVNRPIPDDNVAVARKNTSAATRRLLMTTLPADGREAGNVYLRQQSSKLSYAGQVAPMNIFNPFAWNEFIKAWKRGDYKKKSY